MKCSVHQISYGWSNEEGNWRTCRTYEGEEYIWFLYENLRERGHLGDPDIDERLILKYIF